MLPEYARALFMVIQEKIGRVSWNRKPEQREGGFDPETEGITWRPYCWNDESPETELPNLVSGEVKIRWYKYPGRGLSCNVDWTPEH